MSALEELEVFAICLLVDYEGMIKACASTI